MPPNSEPPDDRPADPDHLLPGEAEAEAGHAAQWIGVYEELLTFKDGLLRRANEDIAGLSPLAHDDAMTDITLITSQAQRYARRLAYWQGLLEPSGSGD